MQTEQLKLPVESLSLPLQQLLPVISNSFIGLPKFPTFDEDSAGPPGGGVFDNTFDATFA